MAISISYSHMDRFFGCGERFRRTYLEKDNSRPGVALPIGSIAHRMRAWYLENFVLGDRELDSRVGEELADLTDDLIREMITEPELHLTRAQLDAGVNATKIHAANLTRSIVKADAQNLWSKIGNAVSAERKIKLRVDGWPYPWSAILDSEHETEQGAQEIVDLKTAKNKPARDSVRSLQLTMYQFMRALEGKPTDILTHHHITKHKKPEVYITRTEGRTEEEIEPLIARAELYCERLEHEIYNPAPEGSWMCSPDWCWWFNECKYSTAERRPST